MFSYLSPEERIPAKHPLRPIRLMVDRRWHRSRRHSADSIPPVVGRRFHRFAV